MRRVPRVLAGCGAAVVAVVAVGGAAVGAWAAGGAEADLAYHGSAALSGGRVDVRFTPHRHGPGAVPDSSATVRLRWSEPLAERQVLAEGCAREGERVVLCRVGELGADGVGERVELGVRLRGVPSEVLLEFDTVRGGGAVDGSQGKDRQRVLVLDTGDTYYF